MDKSENKRQMKDGEVFIRAFRYIYPHMKKFVLSFFLLIVNVALEIYLPIIITNSTNALEADVIDLNYILLLAGSYFLLALVNISFSFCQSVLLQKTGQEIVIKLRDDVFSHIESLSTSQFNDIPVGKLVTRVTNDTVAVSDLFSNILVNLLRNILLIVGTFAIMLVVSPMLTLYMLIFVALVALISFVFRFVARKVFRKERNEISKMNSFISENLSGMKVTQVFNQEERKKVEFEKQNQTLRKASYNVTLAFAFYRPTITLLYVLAVVTCFAVGVPYVESGYITSQVFFLFYLYLGHFFGPVQNLADLLNGVQRALSASERLFLLLDVKPLVEDQDDAISVDKFEGKIVFDHVWFAYVNEDWILKDVSFTIEKGKTAAFVGQTGAGKSTILSLIVRNYDIQKGHIYIDGIDIKHIKLSSLRGHIGQMLQDVFLFSGTIKSNIRLRNKEITDEEISASCQYVNASHFINTLPHGFDEEVKENGSNFSSGERQLLSFARTIVRNPSILILDEATANIDTESELLIQESLEKMKTIGTMLIVAHRLSTVRNADKIIVIDEGKILEEGTHDELMKLDGYYHRLYNMAEE